MLEAKKAPPAKQVLRLINCLRRRSLLKFAPFWSLRRNRSGMTPAMNVSVNKDVKEIIFAANECILILISFMRFPARDWLALKKRNCSSSNTYSCVTSERLYFHRVSLYSDSITENSVTELWSWSHDCNFPALRNKLRSREKKNNTSYFFVCTGHNITWNVRVCIFYFIFGLVFSFKFTLNSEKTTAKLSAHEPCVLPQSRFLKQFFFK